MSYNIKSKTLLLSILLLLSSAFAESPSQVTQTYNQLMEAVKNGDYEKFISAGTSQFKKGLSKRAFYSVHEQLSSSLNSGFSSKYLDSLNQQGVQTHLWKISYSNSSEHTLAKLVLKKNKVAGFWLQ